MRTSPLHAGARPAAAAVWALVVLTVLGLIASLVAAQFLANRRTAEHREAQLQADWLARAGAERAAAALLGSGSPPREQSLTLLPGWHVHVWVEPNPAGPGLFTLTGEARGPAESGTVVRAVTRPFRRVEESGRVRLEARGAAAPAPIREVLPAPSPVRESLPPPSPG